jgi:hypothetical protein
MAWIDTPGLGSMVKENGDLAKAYIQSADYIIYPTSSDSPLQQDETKQLKELFEQNKKVTICITKSDEKEEDECECGSEEGCPNCQNGLVELLHNKPISNRENQEKYVRNEISKIVNNDRESVLGNIFSISTHTATKGLEEKNNELFENSNIPKFYKLITEVVKEKATKLKEETPYDGLKSFIDNNILGNDSHTQKNSIANIKNALNDLNKKIDESIKRFHVLQSNANSDLENEIENVVSEYYSNINQSNAKEIFATIDAELNTKISTIIEINIHEIFADFDTTLKSLTTSFNTNEFTIHDKFTTYSYTTKTRNKKIASGLLGTIATISAGIALASNPVGWAVAGTMATGIVGSYIGGKAGEATSSNKTGKVNIGDNKEEVVQKFKEMRLENYENYAKNLYKEMQNTFFIPLQQTSSEISSDLSKFEKNIANIL